VSIAALIALSTQPDVRKSSQTEAAAMSRFVSIEVALNNYQQGWKQQ
jgi:hypothetical protein